MDEFFGGLDERLGAVSITESTMMRIVHGAMNKAHERVKSKDGVIERLTEISKFYELAVMQLEACVAFIQEESDHRDEEEELLAGLLEFRNLLKGRLSESEVAIADKDRELAGRAESEARLRRELDDKEREFSALNARVERTRTRRDGEFSNLKNSVDQQVWNIRQRLETDYNGRLGDDRGGGGGVVGDEKIEQMGSDIDALKETLDVAFGKMRSAIFLSEAAPIEQQWRWAVEKDTLCVLITGLARDFQNTFEGKLRRPLRERIPQGFDNLWPRFVDEVSGLKSELNSLFAQHEAMVVEAQAKNGGTLQANPNSGEGKDDGEGKHYVAKMIKNHESIIRKKSAEAEEIRREVMREKMRDNKEPESLRRRVNEVIAKLDGFFEWKEKLLDSLGDEQEDEIVFDTLEDAWESMNKASLGVDERVPAKIRDLEQAIEELSLEKRMIEETYVTLFEGLSEELNFELHRSEAMCKDLVLEVKNQLNECVKSNHVESQIREGIYCIVFNEVFEHWNKCKDAHDFDVLVREEICQIVFNETIKTILDNAGSALRRHEELRLTEDSVKDCVLMSFIKETMKQWEMELDEYTKECLVWQEMFQFVVLEAAKDALSRLKDAADQDQGSASTFCEEKSRKYTQFGTRESLTQNEGSELKGNEAGLNLVGLECEVFGTKNALATSNETPSISSVQDRELLIDQSDSLVAPLLRHFQVMADFEHLVGEKLEMNSLRLEEVKDQLSPLVGRISSLREKESLYCRAFIRRCQNLHKAETEVDLLGDQVEALLGLLQKIHKTLQHYSPTFHQNVWVSELLQLIKKELNGVIHSTYK